MIFSALGILCLATQASGFLEQMGKPVGHSAEVSRRGGGLDILFQSAEWPSVSFALAHPLDLSKISAFKITLRNDSSVSQTVGFRMDDDPTGDGWSHSRTAQMTVPFGEPMSYAVALGPDPMSLGMRALPPIAGYRTSSLNGGGSFDFSHVTAMQLFLHQPNQSVKIEVVGFEEMPLAERGLNGIVDSFGQYAKADWPGKISRVEELHNQANLDAGEMPKNEVGPDRDRFGGWSTGPTQSATGYFRTAQVHGKWWLVDPDGKLFFSFGVDVVNMDESTMITGREGMFTGLPDRNDTLGKFWGHAFLVHDGPQKGGNTFNFYGANLYRKFGDSYLTSWHDELLWRLRHWGFNTIGNWSDSMFVGNHLVPYVATLSIQGAHARLSSGNDYWSKMHDPFDPAFQRDVESSLAEAAKFRGDSFCLGFFVDNELSWAGTGPNARYGLALGALTADSNSPGKLEFIKELQRKYLEVGRLNQAWGTHYSDWASMNAPIKLPTDLTSSQKEDASHFVHELAFRYFTIIRDELKKLDPNHLYLGCRFAWYGSEAEQAAAESCDVVSYNIYGPKLDPEKWNHAASLGKPCIIGEFHVGSLDRGMFHPGLVSAASQEERASIYENYVRSVLENSAFVGCHWFQYVDEPLTGRAFDGENYNIGLVSVTDTPYKELVEAARRVQYAGYRIRSEAK